MCVRELSRQTLRGSGACFHPVDGAPEGPGRTSLGVTCSQLSLKCELTREENGKAEVLDTGIVV